MLNSYNKQFLHTAFSIDNQKNMSIFYILKGVWCLILRLPHCSLNDKFCLFCSSTIIKYLSLCYTTVFQKSRVAWFWSLVSEGKHQLSFREQKHTVSPSSEDHRHTRSFWVRFFWNYIKLILTLHTQL